MSNEELALKWGTLKGWNNASDATMARLAKYYSLGAGGSAMMHRDTPEQKAILCEIIDGLDGAIYNDWSGVQMSKDEAKKYVLEHGLDRPAPAPERNPHDH